MCKCHSEIRNHFWLRMLDTIIYTEFSLKNNHCRNVNRFVVRKYHIKSKRHPHSVSHLNHIVFLNIGHFQIKRVSVSFHFPKNIHFGSFVYVIVVKYLIVSIDRWLNCMALSDNNVRCSCSYIYIQFTQCCSHLRTQLNSKWSLSLSLSLTPADEKNHFQRDDNQISFSNISEHLWKAK